MLMISGIVIFSWLSPKKCRQTQELLSGTFHEIGEKIRILNVDEINELYKRKKAYRDYESWSFVKFYRCFFWCKILETSRKPTKEPKAKIETITKWLEK